MKQIEKLLVELEDLYTVYSNEEEDYGQITERLERINKLVIKIRKAQAKEGTA